MIYEEVVKDPSPDGFKKYVTGNSVYSIVTSCKFN